VHGVTTNLGFLQRVVAHPAFAAGATHTGFIAEHWPEGVLAEAASEDALIAAALAEAMGLGRGEAGRAGGAPAVAESVWQRIGPWRGGA
jgi:acetyl/propionyl-CoA carboxylase alpha subunit